MTATLRGKVTILLEILAVYFLWILVFKFTQVTVVGVWQREALGRHYVEYIFMGLTTLAVIYATRKPPVDFGISTRNLGDHVSVAARAFIPISVIKIGLGLLEWRRWQGLLLVAVAEVAALFVIGWLLRRRTRGSLLAIVGGAIFLIELAFFLNAGVIVGESVFSGLLFYFVFVGPAEEMLFRGYFQSRLNEAFGRPYRFFGIQWGWGLVITSFLFGFIHVLNSFNPFLSKYGLLWAWGAWTFLLGLILGIVREKTGSVLAPALLHGALNFF